MAHPTQGHWFLDAQGRTLLLRGVNLGGSNKVPYQPNGATHLPTDFGDHRTVSFIGRPFPLEEADEHYNRLRHWGFNFLRLLTTWEAVEHAGPGEYDEAYLDYLHAVVKKAGDYGFYVFIDPHQDDWSRMTGGDGAPGWTLELAGFDLSRLDMAEAAITQQGRNRADWTSPFPYSPMIWPNSRPRLAASTLFALFFGGKRFAPECKVGDENIQPFLQRHFINAMQAVAARLGEFDHVLGYDSLNEPSAGYIGIPDLNNPYPVFFEAPQLTGFQSLYIPAGYSCEVPMVKMDGLQQRTDGTVILNPDRFCAWRDPQADIWRRHGVWDVDSHGQPQLLRADYFAGVSFVKDCLVPFARDYAEAMRAVDPDAMLFIEGEPEDPEPLHWEGDIPVVNASHWYDVLTLATRHYNPEACTVWGVHNATVEGADAVREAFGQQIGNIVEESRRYLNNAPTVIGEFGLAYNLDDDAAYHTGDFSPHEQALTAYYDALDANLAHSTQWNYTADNDNAHGDQWNGEDLSIYSIDINPGGDTVNGPDRGGRAVRGFCRPHIIAAAGVTTHQSFKIADAAFDLEIEIDPAVAAPTVIYVPRLHYPQGVAVTVTSGWTEYSPLTQQLEWYDAAPGPQKLTLTPKIIKNDRE